MSLSALTLTDKRSIVLAEIGYSKALVDMLQPKNTRPLRDQTVRWIRLQRQGKHQGDWYAQAALFISSPEYAELRAAILLELSDLAKQLMPKIVAEKEKNALRERFEAMLLEDGKRKKMEWQSSGIPRQDWDAADEFWREQP